LSEAIQTLKESIARRKGLTQRTTQHSPVEEEAFLYDVEKCLFSAEVIMSVTITTVYENTQSPFAQMPNEPQMLSELPSELPGSLADELSLEARFPSELSEGIPDLPPRLDVPISRTRTPDPEPRFSTRERSPAPPSRSLKPPTSKHIASALRPKASNPSLDKPIVFHLDDMHAKHRGSFDSDGDSIFDPEPEFEAEFPDAVYSELITGLQQEVQSAMEAGDFQKAEQSHCRAMEYLTDRERRLGSPFNSRIEMHEILAEIYTKQKKLNKAKQVLNRLLSQEKEDTARKWRLYNALANIYLDQDRLAEAEKFAKRAYIGREKSLAKDDPFLLESVALLVKIYEREHKSDTAEALKRVYRAESTPPQVPPKSAERDRSMSQTQSHFQSHFQPQSQLHSQPQSQSRAQLPPYSPPRTPNQQDEAYNGSKSQVRWGPDLWVDSSSINAPTKSGETPLISAINTGDSELVRVILQRGADVEARCVDQISPLMHAVNRRYESIVEMLLSGGAQMEATTAGWTALHRAADMANIPIAKILLSSGASIEARSPKDFTPKKSPLARMGSSDLEEYDEVDASEADPGWTVLLRACTRGQEAMVRFLVDRGADIEARSPSNGTPLSCAAEGNYEAIVDFLLIRNAKVNTEDEFGWKPLHRALVNRGGERTVQMLLTHGALLDSRCNYRKTPLHHAIEKGNDPMVSFLLQAGSDYEARDSAERTPLHTAIECRFENMVRILLEAGADTEAKDQGGSDALAAATHARRKSPEIIGLLSKHKKDKKAKRGSIGSRGNSVSGSSSSRTPINGSSVSSRSSSSTWWSMRSKKEKR